MVDGNQVAMYVCLAFACLFFLIALYVKATNKFPGSSEELSVAATKSRVKWYIALTGILIIISALIAAKRKSSITGRDILEIVVVCGSVLIAWIIAWNDCSEFAMIVSILCAIIACAALDTQEKLN